MSEPPHPYLAPFWRQTGVRHSKSDSMTLNDFTYTLRLDGDTAELTEEEFSYHDSSRVGRRTLQGRWTLVRVEPEKVVLRIAGPATERMLVLLPDDILCGTVEWGMRSHG